MMKTALIFPGQGAQAVGMGRDLAEAFPACKELFDRAGAVLGCNLAQLCFEGPEELLTRSDNAQPAIFTASIACLEALKLEYPGFSFDVTAGLSSGEWAALHAAGVLSFEDAIRILAARGRFMIEACHQQPGAMLSVMNLDLEILRKISAEAGIEIANLNSPGQTVLSGRVEGIERAEILAKEAGAKRAIRLNVSGAFHSSLMNSAADRLAEVLAGISFRTPSVPVVSNVTAEPHGTLETIPALMVRQVNSSVRWVESVEWMKAHGVSRYIECGPGKVLSGLVKRIDKEAICLNILDLESLRSSQAALQGIG